MTTIRGVKDRRFKFVQLLNVMLEDPNISLKAKGFIGFCLTKTENWQFHISYLSSVLKEGEKAIYSVINECIENGYAYRYQLRDKLGKMQSVEYIISDSKEEIEQIKKEIENHPDFKKFLPHRPFGDAGFGEAVNSQGTSKENSECYIYSNTNNSNNKQQQGAVVPSVKKKNIYVCLEKVDIPESQKQEICDRYTEEIVIKALSWALHELNPPNEGLVQSIKYACKHGLSDAEFNKPKNQTPYEKIKSIFQHLGVYNNATCYLNSESIAFERGMTHDSLKLDKFFSWNKLKMLCEKFQILLPG